MNRRRAAKVALVLVVLAGLGLLVASGLRDTLVYYRTPSEVATNPPPVGQRLRLGGQVLPGSLHRDGVQTRFRLTDGTAQIPVELDRGAPPGTFREGGDAVVDGAFDAAGVLHTDSVAVKHNNEYRARDGDR